MESFKKGDHNQAFNIIKTWLHCSQSTWTKPRLTSTKVDKANFTYLYQHQLSIPQEFKVQLKSEIDNLKVVDRYSIFIISKLLTMHASTISS